MGIPAKRFTFLDNETNLAVSDVFDSGNTATLNSPINDLKSFSDQLQGFLLNNNASNKNDLFDALTSSLRVSKDGLPDLNALDGLSQKDFSALADEIFPEDQTVAKNLFSQLSLTCRNRANSKRASGKRYGLKNTCNNKSQLANSTCGIKGPKQLGDIVNKLSGGVYIPNVPDLNAVLDQITSLSSLGYDMNICGVFTALSGGADIQVLSKASGSLSSSLASNRNVLGLLDLSSGSTNLNTKLYNPSVSKSTLQAFQYPTSIRERDNSDLADRYTGALEIFDDKWSNSSYDNVLSTQGVVNSQMGDLLHQKTLDNVYDQNSLDVIPTSNETYLGASF